MSIENEPEIDENSNEIRDLDERGDEPEDKCMAVLRSGRQCRVAAMDDELYCINHSDSVEAQRIREKRLERSIASRRLAVLQTRGELTSRAGLRRVAVRVIKGLAEGSFDVERARTMLAAIRMVAGTFADDEVVDGAADD